MEYWLIRLRQRGLVSIFPFSHASQPITQFPITWYMFFRSYLSINWVFSFYLMCFPKSWRWISKVRSSNASMFHWNVHLTCMIHGMPYLFKVFKTLSWSFSVEYWLIRLRKRGLVSIFPFAHAYQLILEFPITWYMLFRISLSINQVLCLSYVFSQKLKVNF